MKRLIFILFSFLFITCSSENSTDSSSESNEAALFPAFEHFPHAQYHQFVLGKAFQEASLDKNTFALDQHNSAVHYVNFKDSSTVILPNYGILNEFTLFLRSSHYLENEENLFDFFNDQSIEGHHNENFHSFTFQTISNRFRMNYFKQDDFIRLYFTLLTNHS